MIPKDIVKNLSDTLKLLVFKVVKEVGSSPIDLFLRLIWGGAGTLMQGECYFVLNKMKEKLSLIEKV